METTWNLPTEPISALTVGSTSFYPAPSSEIATNNPGLPASTWLNLILGSTGWQNTFLPYILCPRSSQGATQALLKCFGTNSCTRKVTSAPTPNSIYHCWSTVDAPAAHQQQAADKIQWWHYLGLIPLGYQYITYLPTFHFRKGNAREVINGRSTTINILRSCNTRVWTQLNWIGKTLYLFWFLKTK